LILKTVIVDDEPLALDLLSSILADIPEVQVVAQCDNGSAALEAVLVHDADLMFLDIQMPGMHGIDVIRNLQTDHFPMIIFATAFSEYAVNAFDLNAIDYVLKPLDEHRIEQAVKKALNQVEIFKDDNNRKPDLMRCLSEFSDRVSKDFAERSVIETNLDREKNEQFCLAIKDQGKISLILKTDINWVEAAGDYVCVHTDRHTHMMRSTMKEIEEKLETASFCRVHRSTILNLTRVREITPLPKGEAMVRLENDELIKVSRNYRDALGKIVNR